MSKVFNKKILALAFSVFIGLLIWFMPPPEGVTEQGIHMLAIFIFTVIGIILRPVPIGVVAFLGLIALAGLCLRELSDRVPK